VDDRANTPRGEGVRLDWPDGVPKPHIGLVRDTDAFPYWTRYLRFLETNDIPYSFYDIHRSDWLREAERFDLVLWRPMSLPAELDECRRKHSLLEAELDMVCYPSAWEARLYEDKATQYELLRHHGLPIIDTFVSHDPRETMEYLATAGYPLVWKIATGSGSLGVELVRGRRAAERMVRAVFGSGGRRTYWPYLRQKDYAYLQRHVPNTGVDERVIVIGSHVFGYYRDVPPGEFRASGMGLVRDEAPSMQAVDLARTVARALDLPCVAVDMLTPAGSDRREIIELSQFWRIDKLGEMRLDGVSGAYVFDGGDCSFRAMEVWPQELALKHVLETRWIARRGSA
jgi:glutathione synthase/RimK-type ligase-like ATP-grasp enzyme